MSSDSKNSVVFLSGKRTPFGAFGGSLKDLSATELGVRTSQAALEQANVKPEEIDHVIFGNVVQSDSNSIYLSRHIGLHCNIPKEVPALTVNRLCGSGFEALIQSAYHLLMDGHRYVLAGGSESMSQVPFVVRNARWGQKMGHHKISDYLMESLEDGYCQTAMAETAENLARAYEISREQSDEYALLSQKRTEKAYQKGHFKEELISLEVSGRKGPFQMEKDEHPRPQTTTETLAKLKPAFRKDGMVTAGNASGMVDGAASLVCSTEEVAKSEGKEILGYLKNWAVVGVEPKEMGAGPIAAIHKLLQKSQLKLQDIQLFEVNEAFAPQYLAVEKALGLPRERTNVNGGAIAIGHPLGATGARIAMNALYELRRRKERYGVVSACIGGGQGIALLLENR